MGAEAASPGGRSKISSRPKKLSLIHVHLYRAEQRRREFYLDVRRYFPSLLFLIILYANMESTAPFVRQAEWMRSILLEDEFTDPTQTANKDYAKSSFTVESLQDIWDWGESLVLGSFYQPAVEEPALLFDHNLLVGAIQIMQVRTTSTSAATGQATCATPAPPHISRLQLCARLFACRRLSASSPAAPHRFAANEAAGRGAARRPAATSLSPRRWATRCRLPACTPPSASRMSRPPASCATAPSPTARTRCARRHRPPRPAWSAWQRWGRSAVLRRKAGARPGCIAGPVPPTTAAGGGCAQGARAVAMDAAVILQRGCCQGPVSVTRATSVPTAARREAAQRGCQGPLHAHTRVCNSTHP